MALDGYARMVRGSGSQRRFTLGQKRLLSSSASGSASKVTRKRAEAHLRKLAMAKSRNPEIHNEQI